MYVNVQMKVLGGLDLQKRSFLKGLLLVLKGVLEMMPRFWPCLIFPWDTIGWDENIAVGSFEAAFEVTAGG